MDSTTENTESTKEYGRRPDYKGFIDIALWDNKEDGTMSLKLGKFITIKLKKNL